MLFPSNLKSDVARDDLQGRLLVQHSITTLLQHYLELLQHCPNIAMLYCAQNGRCESYRVTSPLMFLEPGDFRETKLTVSRETTDFAMLPAQRFWRETVSLLDVM